MTMLRSPGRLAQAAHFALSPQTSRGARHCTAIFLSSALRNSALSLGSDRGAGDKRGERRGVRLDLGRVLD